MEVCYSVVRLSITQDESKTIYPPLQAVFPRTLLL